MNPNQKTPAQVAEHVLQDSRAMCDFLAACRVHKVPGWWDGSAFRGHPVGLIVGTIKLTNYWRVDQYASITITDGEGWNREVCKNSLAYGNPHPEPISGNSVLVWRCGSWISKEFEEALRPKMLQILTSAAEHIIKSQAAASAAEAERSAEAAAARKAAVAVAVAKAAAS